MAEDYNRDAPLGAEDAAKREDVADVFVDVRELIPQTSLHTNDIKAIRIVVGKKGSGKTHILRYIESESQGARTVIYCTLSDNAIPIALESQFSREVDRPHARSRWSKFWRIVLSVSILSRFISAAADVPQRRAATKFLIDQGYTRDEVRADEWKTTRELLIRHFADSYFPKDFSFRLANLRGPRDPTSVIHRLLDGVHSLRAMDELIDFVEVSGLEAEIGALAKGYRPFHIIIDGIDDVSWRQPRAWLDFQVGLFDATFYFQETLRSSEQVAVTVAMRNFIYLSAAESPHIDRIRNLLSLNWTPTSALAFLNRRLNQIAKNSFADAPKLASDRPLAAWLGFDSVVAVRRSVEESVEAYVLRHTRLSPRNLIRLFNLLVQEKNRKTSRQETFDADDFRQIVGRIGEEVAELMLKVAAEEIIAFIAEVSDTVVRAKRSEGVVTWVAWTLEEAIRAVGNEVMDAARYDRFLVQLLEAILPDHLLKDRASGSKFEEYMRTVELVLWRCNVIAFRDDRRFKPGWVFSWSPREDVKPQGGGDVGFHSALIPKCDLEVSEHGPVF
ncbi:MAG TPA: hypothetical protein VEA60_11970 [Allosphingosinicella sp.]|nr:hypothetical protein [Allosphingosinicella sp.]